ncbi:unnamed protein product [Clonostachys rosea]|uniref:Uncharacterized protein n=1 Tax=Bionectria ochroleuca TaxID=29856 RepID=A0ABY6UM24_BIOOC|nr:unnamed protein product [Clonostachys rosea]
MPPLIKGAQNRLWRPPPFRPFTSVLSSDVNLAQGKPRLLSSVRAVPFPQESSLAPLYKSAFFVDSFAVSFPLRKPNESPPDALAQAFFSEWPAWFSLAMWIRDEVMAIFGVKRSTEIQAEAEKNGVDTIAVFPVRNRTKDEIIVGEDDSHLDFQTSILIRRERRDGGTEHVKNIDEVEELVVTTVVHCHGLFGKIYITIIRAFHVMIVRYSLARVPSRVRQMISK